ncbi:MAG: hypothetical protein JO180_07045 [Gemmatirosa sp.]|nr:hypothetical protein [Gemmatirosa sp.]
MTGPVAGDEWLFADAERCDTARCATLLAQLHAMPRTGWLEIGRRELAAGGASLASAESTLGRVIDERRLGVTAWLVRDAVDTAAHHTSMDQGLLFAARRAAQRAALAHLARPWLPRDAYVALIAPFFFVAAERA